MDYKRIIKYSTVTIFILVTGIIFSRCSDKEKMNTGNTYYIELVNCTDSLKQKIEEGIVGKVSYYKDHRLQIMSLNYVTDDYPDMHYFKSITESGQTIKKGTLKIKIEFSGSFTIDSTFYSIQKFKYNNGEWKKFSDMGVIKATSMFTSVQNTDLFRYKEFPNQVVQNVVSGTY